MTNVEWIAASADGFGIGSCTIAKNAAVIVAAYCRAIDDL